jgi:hypothetical protein
MWGNVFHKKREFNFSSIHPFDTQKINVFTLRNLTCVLEGKICRKPLISNKFKFFHQPSNATQYIYICNEILVWENNGLLVMLYAFQRETSGLGVTIQVKLSILLEP